MSPMPEYSDEDLSPVEPKSFSNGLCNNSKISVIIEENGTVDNNESIENAKDSLNNEKSKSNNENGNLTAEVCFEITESINIAEVSI